MAEVPGKKTFPAHGTSSIFASPLANLVPSRDTCCVPSV
jgi:hypothetical protein